jgi:hypothetical protein
MDAIIQKNERMEKASEDCDLAGKTGGGGP